MVNWECIYPKQLKYKGHTITQDNGEVTVKNEKNSTVLLVPVSKTKNIRELRELFDFNEKIFFGGG